MKRLMTFFLMLQVTREKIENWFKKMEQDLDEGIIFRELDPSQIFNCDETGFALTGHKTKVLSNRLLKHQYEVSIYGFRKRLVVSSRLFFPKMCSNTA